MRRVSLNARLALDQMASDEVEAILVRIVHPEHNEPILLSSDPTERLSTDPLAYGTRSTWKSSDGTAQSFLFIMLDVIIPDEKEDAPAQASLVFELLDSALGELLASTTKQATCSIAVVMASSPDQVEAEWTDLKLSDAQVDTGQVSLRFSKEDLLDEPYPADRMTKERFPGLHR